MITPAAVGRTPRLDRLPIGKPRKRQPRVPLTRYWNLKVTISDSPQIVSQGLWLRSNDDHHTASLDLLDNRYEIGIACDENRNIENTAKSTSKHIDGDLNIDAFLASLAFQTSQRSESQVHVVLEFDRSPVFIQIGVRPVVGQCIVEGGAAQEGVVDVV